ADAAVAVLAQDEAALVVEGQAVGAGLALALLGAGVAGRLHEDGGALALLPLHDAVVRDVGEQEEAAVALDPDRPFGPRIAVGQLLDLGVLVEQLVEAGFEALD